MKQIQIVIPDGALKDVDEVLRETQVGGMTHHRVEGREPQGQRHLLLRGGTMKYTPEYLPRTKVELVVKDDHVDLLLRNITDRLGVNGISGKIFVLEVPFTFDIRT
jgi:nitrogen regulatory protein P-II 1